MSTLNVSNITDGTDTVGTSYVLNGSAKFWVNFNGNSTPTARDSLNLSSITDDGAGQYLLNFTNAFNNTGYSSPSAGADSTGTGRRIACPHADDEVTTTYYKLQILNDAGTRLDGEYLHSASFGDLA